MKRIDFLNKCNRDDLDEYIIYDEEFKTNDKILFHHKSCNRDFYMKATNFKTLKYRCPLCYGNKNKLNYDKVKNEINSDDYELLETKFVNILTPMKVLHKSGNHIFEVSYSSWKHKNVRCKICANNMKLSPKFIANQINKIDSNYFSTDESATNAHSKILIHHKICNRDFLMQYNNFKYGQRCPYCILKNRSKNISKKAKEIMDLLDKYDIIYEVEKKFDDLISDKNRKLRYDFFISEFNLLLEYQGEQHFLYYKSGIFTKEKYDKIKKNDNIKYKYAISHNFNIEYINYNDDIETCLKNIINKYKKDIVEKS